MNGHRGIIVFIANSARKNRSRLILHIHLQKGLIVQYSDTKKKVILCDEICNISRISGREISMEIKVEININLYIKKLLFNDEVSAGKFHQYIEFIMESGKHIRKAFSLIDTRKTMKISAFDLRKGLVRVDLDIKEEDITSM